MKKCILLLLAALLLVCGAMAEEETPQPPRCAPGETVDLRLCLTVPEMAGMQLRLSWDPEVMELAEESPELAAFFSQDAMLSMVYAEPEEGVMTLVWLQATDVTLTDMPVLDFSLRIREDAPGGEAQLTILDHLLTDVAGTPLLTQAEGMTFIIDAPRSTPEPTLTPEPTPEPDVTPEPCEAFLWVTLQEDEPISPDSPGQYIPSRPGGSMDMEVITPSPAPTATPAPTPVTVVIGATPTPPVRQDKLQLRTVPTSGGFRLEIVAQDVDIGGLQATISYDPHLASCTGAAFTDAFVSPAMVKMIHQTEGCIRLVYSSMEGYTAQGEVIFSADFAAAQGTQLVLTLADVKCTNAEAELTMWQQQPQQVTLTIPPNGVSSQMPESITEGAEVA